MYCPDHGTHHGHEYCPECGEPLLELLDHGGVTTKRHHLVPLGIPDLRNIARLIRASHPTIQMQQLAKILDESPTTWGKYVHGAGNPGVNKVQGWLDRMAEHGLSGHLLWVPAPGGKS